METNLPDKIKKNLLDLQYSKYLQFYNTSIILLFTFLIGIGIAFMTKQIDYTRSNQMLSVAIITIAVVVIIVLLMLRSKWHMSNIFQEIKMLKF